MDIRNYILYNKLMINNEKTLVKYGYTFETAIDKKYIVCDCDFCGAEFERLKGSLRRVLDLSTLSCTNKSCIKEKTKSTNLAKYGTVSPTQNKNIKEKVKETTLAHYGVENVFQSKEIKQRIKTTNLKNLGVEYPSQSQVVQDKIKQKSIKEYQVNHFLSNEEVKAKIKSTFLDKYGYSTSTQHPDIKEKTKTTCLEKYGVDNPRQYFLFQEKIIETNIAKYGEPFPNFKTGKTQESIKKELNSFGFNFQSDYNILNGKEIDLYDDQLKLGIEYCGLFWHHENSPKPRDRHYHYDKYLKAHSNGVQLLTIFEDEYKSKRDIVLSVILSKIGKFKKRIYGRKCQIVELKLKEVNNFIKKNHLQGVSKSTIGFGLLYENELVGAMTLGKHHRNTKSKSLILNRMCFLPNTQILGGADKLFKTGVSWAKNNGYDKIISWSDNRWSKGTVYEKLGFVLEEELKPDYSYVLITRPKKRFSKQSMKKNNINCPSDITEKDWCLAHGFSRIWDCGKKRWGYQVQ